MDPLTGSGAAPQAPLVAVKIDNGTLARPFHRGLDSAAMVYLELVEGGATRMVGIWSQAPDAEIGPVRSFRESDIELLEQFGRVAIAFSGANDVVLRSFRGAVEAGRFVDVSFDAQPDLYRIGERRRDAKNFYTSPSRLADAAGRAGGQPAKATGLTFAATARPDAAPGTSASIAFSRMETVQATFDAATGTYRIAVNGTPLNGAAPANVVIQQVPVRDAGCCDAAGNPTPYSVSVGTGAVDVLRDGVRVSGQWQRPSATEGTRLLTPDGADIPLKPGQTWVLLQPAGSGLSIG